MTHSHLLRRISVLKLHNQEQIETLNKEDQAWLCNLNKNKNKNNIILFKINLFIFTRCLNMVEF